MMKKKLNRSWPLVAVGAATVALTGLFVGSAAAQQGPVLFAPIGLTSPNAEVVPAPQPKYEVNESGLTFGSLAEAVSPETEPDLVLVEMEDGRTGYAYTSDLDKVRGPGADASPEQALAWQRNRPQFVSVPVYDVDGKTKIGEFSVGGSGQVIDR